MIIVIYVSEVAITLYAVSQSSPELRKKLLACHNQFITKQSVEHEVFICTLPTILAEFVITDGYIPIPASALITDSVHMNKDDECRYVITGYAYTCQ